jgi:hypothetical protein
LISKGEYTVDFKTSLTVYNRKINKELAAKTLTFDRIEEYYKSLEEFFQPDILKILKKIGVLSIIDERHKKLSNYFSIIDDYVVSIKTQVLSISLNNGSVISNKPGSLKKIIQNEFEMDSTNEFFYLVMGYVYTNSLDTLLLTRAIEEQENEGYGDE